MKLDKQKELHYAYRIPIVSEQNIAQLAQDKGLSKINNFQSQFNNDNTFIEQYIDNKPIIIVQKVVLGYRYTELDVIKINKHLAYVNRKINAKEVYAELCTISPKFYGTH